MCVSSHFISPKKRSGYEIKDGKKENIDIILDNPTLDLYNLTLNGHFKIGASFRAAAGFEIAAAFAATIGANIEAYAEAEGKLGFSAMNPGWLSPEGKLSIWVDAFGDVQLHVAPFGIHMLDKRIAKFFTKHLVKFSTSFTPTIFTKNGNCTMNDGYLDATAYFSMKDLDGLNAWLSNGTYYPAMRMYIGPTEKENYIDMVMTDGKEDLEQDIKARPEVEEKTTYRFKATGIVDDDESEVHFVPYLYSLKKEKDASATDIMDAYVDDAIMCDKDQIDYEIGKPVAAVFTANQLCGIPLNDWSDYTEGYVDYSGTETGGHSAMNPQDFHKIKYCTTVDVRNGSRMQSWGIRVTIYDLNGKVLLQPRKVPINVCKSGRYTLVFSFVTNWKPMHSVEGGEKLYIVMRPYWKFEGNRYNANDVVSKRKWEIEYDFPDVSFNISKLGGSEEWGTIMPEKVLEQEHGDD